jgi:hypothetical protein
MVVQFERIVDISLDLDAKNFAMRTRRASARKRAMATVSSSDAAMPAMWPRHDSSEIRVVPSCDQRRKPRR